MKIVFIRHGEPDYKPCDEEGFCGMGRDMAPLTNEGRNQAKKAAQSDLLEGIELVLSSPYTRTMETASIVSLLKGVPLKAEVGLHELIPDKTFQNRGPEETYRLQAEFKACEGVHPEGKICKWETMQECVTRVRKVLDYYLLADYQKIAVVSHGGVIRRFAGNQKIKYCSLFEIDYSKNFECYGWITLKK